MTATLSLYKLDSELTDLLEYRADRVADTQSPASAEELEACDTAIRQYMEQLPRKVDGVASFIRHCERLIEEDDAEIARYKAHRSAVIDNRDRVKDGAAAVLEKQPQPAKGCRKLVGQNSTITLKKNGGIAPLVISQPDLTPDELCEYQGKFSHDQYFNVWASLTRDGWESDDIDVLFSKFTRTPSNALIREALLQPCSVCQGGEAFGFRELPCTACGGSGRSSVPGAHLEERGQHVEIR